MHSKGNYESSNEGSKVINNTKETSSSLVEEGHKAKRSAYKLAKFLAIFLKD